VSDAIVVLGCRIEAGGVLSPAAERRARAAAARFASFPVKWLLASGGRRWFGTSEAEALASRLAALGVPAEAIAQELCSLSTWENAQYSARWLADRGVRSVVVVTCDWHLPRALASFRAVGVQARGEAAASPPASTFKKGTRALREQVSFWLDRAMTWG
jgi:uncharacterized SAM-binding protein YcdF (DUF218 family)